MIDHSPPRQRRAYRTSAGPATHYAVTSAYTGVLLGELIVEGDAWSGRFHNRPVDVAGFDTADEALTALIEEGNRLGSESVRQQLIERPFRRSTAREHGYRRDEFYRIRAGS